MANASNGMRPATAATKVATTSSAARAFNITILRDEPKTRAEA